jgi:hypothetical protein
MMVQMLTALSAGFGDSDGFIYVGGRSFWWSASERNSDFAYDRGMYSVNWDVSDLGGGVKSFYQSVRCLQD